jgi:hypothetical protein
VPTNTATVAWGDAATAARRWGANTPKDIEVLEGGGYSYDALVTVLGSAEGSDEAALADRDSGCALFQSFGGGWRLAGLGAAVDVIGSSTFGQDARQGPGRGDANYFVRIRSYAAAIMAVVHPAPVLAGIAPSSSNVVLSASNLVPGAACDVEVLGPDGAWSAWTSFVAGTSATLVSAAGEVDATRQFRIRSMW